jgi:hypothetical protein
MYTRIILYNLTLQTSLISKFAFKLILNSNSAVIL